jgi:hypothetical protein
MKILSSLDLSKNELQNARIQNLATAPANPVPGQIFFHTGDQVFYGWDGTAWVDLGQELDGSEIVSLINASTSTVDDDNLSAAANDAITKRHAHSNKATLDQITAAYTSGEKTKLAGISPGATKVEQSATNGNIKIDGTERTVYTHPGSGTNPHGTTKADVGLGNVENKSSATIRSELTSGNVTGALGYTPIKNGGSTPEIRAGLESARPTATGSGLVYFATDTKKIWKDIGTWEQMGGQELPIASPTTLGGIKVGANLTILPDGTLNANDNPASFIIKQEQFTVGSGQTTFTLTKGTYKPGTNSLFWYMHGQKQPSDALVETSPTTFQIAGGLEAGTDILVEYIELISASPYPVHASEHLSDGVDPIPVATSSADGLMAAADKSKLDGVAPNANNYTHPTTAGNKHIPSGGAANQILKYSAAGTAAWASMSDAIHGTRGGGTQHAAATQSVAGFMAAADKAKLDGIAAGANAYTHPTGDGNLHVPATGTSNNGKVLKAGSTAGSLSWGTLYADDVGAVPATDVVAEPAANKILRLDGNGNLPASVTGNAATATKLANARSISLSGDATGSTTFDGSANRTIAVTLANSGVSAGTYPKVTVDAKGRVTSGSSLSATDIPSLTLSKISDAGTAASKNIGTASGDVPVLGAGGKLDTAVLPALAITETYVVSSQSDMLALSAQTGDVAIRTDLHRNFILREEPASTLANWEELLSPPDAVSSVNGKTGAVTLGKSDVGLGNVDNVKQAPATRTITAGNGLTGGGDLTANRTLTLGTPGTLTPSTSNAVTTSSHTHSIDVATQAEAEAGTSAAKFMTPQRTSQAIAALQAVKSVAGKTGVVTLAKGDVGLGSVDNVQQASKTEFNAHAGDNVAHVTAGERSGWNAKAGKYSTNLGNGSATQFTVTHNLGSMDVVVGIRETAAPYSVVYADVQIIDANSLRVLFGAAPSSGQYRATVIG